MLKSAGSSLFLPCFSEHFSVAGCHRSSGRDALCAFFHVGDPVGLIFLGMVMLLVSVSRRTQEVWFMGEMDLSCAAS